MINQYIVKIFEKQKYGENCTQSIIPLFTHNMGF